MTDLVNTKLDVRGLMTISEQLEVVNFGFKINFLFKEQIFEFEVYEGNKSSAIFSFEFNNISEQEYYEDLENEKILLFLKMEDILITILKV